MPLASTTPAVPSANAAAAAKLLGVTQPAASRPAIVPAATARSDDQVLGSLLSKAAAAPAAPKPIPGVPKATPVALAAPAAPTSSVSAPPAPPPPPSPPPAAVSTLQAERDADIVGGILTSGVVPLPPRRSDVHRSAPQVESQDQVSRDGGVLDSFLRKHGSLAQSGPNVRRNERRNPPAPILTTLESAPPSNEAERDDQVLRQLVAKSGARPSAEVSHACARQRGLGLPGTPTARRDDAVVGQLLQHASLPNATSVRKNPVAASLRKPGAVGGYPEAASRSLESGGGPPGSGYGATATAASSGYGVQARRGSNSGRGAGGKRGTGPGRGVGKARINVDIIEDRAKPDLEEENLHLRRSQTDLRCRIGLLESKLRTGKEDPWQDHALELKNADIEQLQRALSLPGPSAVRKQQTSTSPGARRGPRGARQHSQRRVGLGRPGGGGKLRGRMTALPWGQAAAAPELRLMGANVPSPCSPVHRSLSPKHVPSKEIHSGGYGSSSPPAGHSISSACIGLGGTGRVLVPPAFSEQHPTSPKPKPQPITPEPHPTVFPPHSTVSHVPPSVSPIPPPTGDIVRTVPNQVGAVLRPAHTSAQVALPDRLHPAAPVVDNITLAFNRQKADELRAHNKELASKLDQLLVGRISEEHSSSKYAEKAKVKDAQIRALEATLARQREKANQAEVNLQADAQRLQTELAVLKTELYYAQVQAGGSPDDYGSLQRLHEVQAENDSITRQIRELTVRAFASTEDQRMISEQRLKELEVALERKREECEKLSSDRQKVDEEREQVVRDVSDLEQRNRNLLEDNERLAVRMDEKAQAVRRAQAQLVGILDSLSEEDRKVMVFSLQFLREREEKAAAEVAARVAAEQSSRPVPLPPPVPPLGIVPPGRPALTVEEMTRRVDSLRAEKDELAQELRALQDICHRERDITKDLRSMHRLDLDELGLQMQTTMADTERFKKLSAEREQRLKELQLQLVKRREQTLAQPAALRGSRVGSHPEVVSEGGFSELSEVEPGKNVLDLYVTVGRIEERALLELPQRQGGVTSPVPPEEELVTMVLAEFMHCDLGCSETAASLRPRYDSLVSFGPFEVGDAEIEHLTRGSVRLELQAFASSGSAAYVLGRASLPLAALLDCTPHDLNPTVAGTLCFASEADTRIQIATVRYKARWRKSILQPLQDYSARRGSLPLDATSSRLGAGGGIKAAAGLMDAARTLVVHVMNVTELVSPRPGVPAEILQPYVSYEVPGHKEHHTQTGNGPNVAFEDVSTVLVRVDTEFCRWAETGSGMLFMVCDEAMPPVGTTEEQLGLIGEMRLPVAKLLSSPFAQVQGRFPLHRTASPGMATELPPVGYIEVSVRWQDDASAVLAPPIEADYFAGAKLLTDEQYQVVWQRVLRRLHVLQLAPVDWFYKQDVDKDGFWSKLEACAALAIMPIGLSASEIEQVFIKMDSRKRGLASLEDLAAAFEECKKAAPLEQWCRDAYRRVAEALSRQGWTAEQAFDAVAPYRQAQKREFFALLTSLDIGMRSEQLEWMWRLSDINSDGLLDFQEFASRLRDVTSGTSTTSFTVPKPGEDVTAPPDATVSAAAAAAAMSEAWHDICLLRLMRGSEEVGWKTVDKAVDHIPTREDGLVARAELFQFAKRCRAHFSDWELDKMFARLDAELRGAIAPRALRIALLRCDVLDSPAQASMRRAGDCMSIMHQGLLRYRPAATVSALRTVFSEVAAQLEPLVVQREELLAVAVRLGADKVWLDELWFSSPKLRDNSLDIEAFAARVAAAPLPGEGTVDELTDEHATILLGRLRRALDKCGGAEAAFHKFRTGSDGCLSRGELEAVLADTTKDVCSPYERTLLVRRIDKNDDGRISLRELEEALSVAHVSSIAMRSWAEDVCERVMKVLRREGRTVDELFEALAGGPGKAEVHWKDFHALFARLEPTLTEVQLRRLWQLFDKNGDGGVSRAEFQRALTLPEAAPAGPDASAEVAPVAVLASRVGRFLGQGVLPPGQALATYGGSTGSLDLNAWLDACRGLDLPLSRAEATALHASLARGPVGGGYVTAEAFASEASRAAAQGVPEERWARDFVLVRTQLAADAGAATPAEAVQAAAAGAEAVNEELLRTALGRHCPIPDQTWSQLRLLVERRFADGLVLWRPFLQWASGLGAGAPLSKSVGDDVCLRVLASLRRNGKTLDELFDDLAGVKAAVHWHDFNTFFSQLDASLSKTNLEHLWQSFDKNGDGSVSREEFTKRMGDVLATAKKATTAICARVGAALHKSGKSVDELFDALAGVKAVVHWADFRALFEKFEPSLSDKQLQQLWWTFDADDSGGVSRDEFHKALAPAGLGGISQPQPKAKADAKAAPKMGAKPKLSEEICSRVSGMLRRERQTEDQLFDALAGGKEYVCWPDFQSLFAQLGPSLTVSQLEELWSDFDKNHDNNVCRTEFKRALSAVGSSAQEVAQSVCKKVVAALQQKGQSVEDLFDALRGDQSTVQQKDFVDMFSQLEPSLSHQQLEFLWRTFDKDGDGGVTRVEFQRALQIPPAALSAKDSEVVATPEVFVTVAAALRREGKTADQLFEALSAGKTSIARKDFNELFAKLAPSLSKADVDDLWRRVDTDENGSLSRQEFSKALAPASKLVAKPSLAPRPLAPPPVRDAPETPGLEEAVWAAIAEVAFLRANGVPRSSPGLTQAVASQLSAFDVPSTGYLDRQHFGQALRSYSPGLADAAIEALWAQVSADGKVAIPQLVERMVPPPQPPSKSAEGSTQKEPGDALWAALRRIRPALHEQGLRLRHAFERWLPQGASHLTLAALSTGVDSLVGGLLPELQLQALFNAMVKDQDQGASALDFVTAFGHCSGEGFEAFGRDLLGRAGRAMIARAKGSVSGAFATLDLTGDMEVRKDGFRAAMIQFGDLNLNNEQVDKLWELAQTLGGCTQDGMDFVAFKTVFASALASPGPSEPSPLEAAMLQRPEPGPSLEESCTHLDRLQRIPALREAMQRRNPDGVLSFAELSSALREAGPELSDDEVAQVCRLALQKGGPLHGEDAYFYAQLLERFDDGHKDYHPLHISERPMAADVCRYVDQRVQAWGYASVAAALGNPSTILASALVDHLQRYLPVREQDRRAGEHLLRLGRPLGDGRIDAEEFCRRFHLLARAGGAASLQTPPAETVTQPSPSVSQDALQVCIREKPCPVDLQTLGLARQSELAARLRREFPDGTVLFHKLAAILDAELKHPPTVRQKDHLKKWLQHTPDGLVLWPLLLSFQVTVEKVSIMATKELRKLYPQIQFCISFCGREVKLKRMPWRMGLMCLSTPNTMELQPQLHVNFILDGPNGLPGPDLVTALSQSPEPPQSHRLRLILLGVKSGEECKELGAFELCAGEEIPSSDLRAGDAVRSIQVSTHQAGLSAVASDGPALKATVALSTRRAGRLRELAGGGVSGLG